VSIKFNSEESINNPHPYPYLHFFPVGSPIYLHAIVTWRNHDIIAIQHAVPTLSISLHSSLNTNTIQSYDSLDPDLCAARFKARSFAHHYNTWFPDPSSTTPTTGFDVLASERMKQLKTIIGHIGSDDIFIEPPFSKCP
jgi:hypothetical protein